MPGHALARPVYGSDALQPLIRPGSIAVVGASAKGTGFGAAALTSLSKAEFTGSLYTVNPRYSRGEVTPTGAIGLPSLADLPNAVDCVLIAVPATAVEAAVIEAADRGCRSAIIFSAGFGETADGQARQARLGDIAQSRGIRLGGPNTAGVLNYRDKLPLTFLTDLHLDLPVGNIAIVSQSAGLATHLGHRRRRGAGLSYTITTGNSVDVNALDYVNFLLEDDATDVIALALEGISNASALRTVAERAHERGKAILVLKSGRTAKGSQAAVSHTGSLAGSHEVFVEALADLGLQLFTSAEELLDAAVLFSRWRDKPYRRGGVAVLTTMGGPGVLAADAAEDAGVALPEPSPATAARLAELVPSFAATGNPIDTTAFQSDEVLAECLVALAADDTYSAVLLLLATTTGAATAGRPAAVAAAARRTEAPLCAIWLSSWLEGPGSEVLDSDPDVPLLRSTASCFTALARWRNWHEHRLARAQTPPSSDPVTAALPQEVQSQIQASLVAASGTTLDELDSRGLLELVGVPFPSAVLATSRSQAEDAAGARPVVLKVVSADIPHKAAAGGVRVGVVGAQDVGDAYDGIQEAVQAHAPAAEVRGVMVVEMRPLQGEFMCGMVRDPVFGPVVVVGAGGGNVELLRDVARCVAPVTERAALRAVHRLRAHAALQARSPEQAGSVAAMLGQTMMQLSSLAISQPGLAEVDINPIGVDAEGRLLALDALVVAS